MIIGNESQSYLHLSLHGWSWQLVPRLQILFEHYFLYLSPSKCLSRLRRIPA